MTRLQAYVEKYGPEVGPKFYRLIQSRSARVGVSARLRRKIEAIEPRPAPAASGRREQQLPLFRDVRPIADEPALR